MRENMRLAQDKKRTEFDKQQENKDDDTERKFQEIERYIQIQKETMNARLQRHQTEYEQINESVQKLLKLIEEGQERVSFEESKQPPQSTTVTMDTSSASASVSASASASATASALTSPSYKTDQRTTSGDATGQSKVLLENCGRKQEVHTDKEGTGNIATTKASKKDQKGIGTMDKAMYLKEGGENMKNITNKDNRGQAHRSNRQNERSAKTHESPANTSSKGAVPEESLENVLSALEEARIDDAVMPPKGRGLDTVICLDTSESMGNDGLEEVKKIAMDFVNGIEDIVRTKNMEENIAVVKFGGRPKIVSHLTDDYNSIRDKIAKLELGGQTPLLEGFQVGLCALECGRGKVIVIGGSHVLSPRLLVITDGKPSEGYGGSRDTETAAENVKIQFLQVVQQLRSRHKEPIIPRPFIWIAAGQADRKFLQSLAEHSDGIYMEGYNVKSLCRYQHIQNAIGRIYTCLQTVPLVETVDCQIESGVAAYAGDMNVEDRKYIFKAVQDKVEGKEGCGNYTSMNSDFDDEMEFPQLPALGTRVVRGPDWEHKNQDGEGPGTIYQHLEHAGILSVHWDIGTKCQYHYGKNGCYHVKVVKDQPRNTENDYIEIGCEVTRGPDWNSEYGEQDGGAGCVGVVIRKGDHSKYKVRWRETCFIGSYTYRRGGRRDLLLRDPMDILKEVTKEEATGHSFISDSGSKAKTWTWKWMDESNNWNEYSPEIVAKLEKAFSNSKSCLIKKGSQSYRILFKDMVEKNVEGGSRRKIQRLYVDN